MRAIPQLDSAPLNPQEEPSPTVRPQSWTTDISEENNAIAKLRCYQTNY